MSDLAKHLDRAISSLQRELASLHDAGILESKREGNRAYYRADSDCPIYLELRSIITKTTGLLDQVLVLLTPHLKKIQLAFIYGSIARYDDESTSDVDLFIIGELGVSDLYPSLREVESQIGREITPIIYSVEEFRQKLDDGNHFLNSILETERLEILGNADDLERLTGR
ncbi:ArsR family transcriptional regulator [Candidatus Zixiibacteriota bacterium]